MFKDAIGYAAVKVHRGGLMGLPEMSNNAMTPFGEMHFPQNSYLPDFAAASTKDKVWFIHEMTHVWQYQLGYGVAFHGIVIGAKGGYMAGAPAYRYDPVADSGKTLPDFNMEQQGEIVSHYFDAKFLADSSTLNYHALYVSRLGFYEQALAGFIGNPDDALLLPQTTRIEL